MNPFEPPGDHTGQKTRPWGMPGAVRSALVFLAGLVVLFGGVVAAIGVIIAFFVPDIENRDEWLVESVAGLGLAVYLLSKFPKR